MKLLIVGCVVAAVVLIAWWSRRWNGPDYSRRFAPVPGGPGDRRSRHDAAASGDASFVWFGSGSDGGSHAAGGHSTHAADCSAGSHGGGDCGSGSH